MVIGPIRTQVLGYIGYYLKVVVGKRHLGDKMRPAFAYRHKGMVLPPRTNDARH